MSPSPPEERGRSQVVSLLANALDLRALSFVVRAHALLEGMECQSKGGTGSASSHGDNVSR